MAAKRINDSKWDRCLQDMRTNHGRVNEALGDPEVFREMLDYYKKPICKYLILFLLHYKLFPDDVSAVPGKMSATEAAKLKEAARLAWAKETAKLIWDELISQRPIVGEQMSGQTAKKIRAERPRTLPEILAAKWGKEKTSFRELLKEAVHFAYNAWAKPGAKSLTTPDPGDELSWNAVAREDILNKSLKKLRSYQDEFEAKGNLYYVVFRLWQDHREESLTSLRDRLEALPGGRHLEMPAFKTALSRARDKFGTFMADELTVWLSDSKAISTEDYRRAFEELDLMDDYAIYSKTCLALMGK